MMLLYKSASLALSVVLVAAALACPPWSRRLPSVSFAQHLRLLLLLLSGRQYRTVVVSGGPCGKR
jgi:hypothetical protein